MPAHTWVSHQATCVHMYVFNTYMYSQDLEPFFFFPGENCRSAVVFVWSLHHFFSHPLFFYITYLLCCPASIHVQAILFQSEHTFCFCVAGLWSLTFLFQGEERHTNTSKQTNKQKKPNFCFIGSEAETHDVISDANVIYFLRWGWMFGSVNM